MGLVKMLFARESFGRFAGVLSAVASLTVSAGPAFAQSSIAYMDINTADAAQYCKTLEASSNEEGPGSAALVCDGYGGIELYLDYYDARDAIRVGRDGVGTPFLPQFTSFGPKAEWRVEAGVPVAMILRMQLGGSSPGNWLTVHKVDAATQNGCVMGYVDARANRNANLLARDMAAEVAGFVCGRSPLQFFGAQSELMRSLLPRLEEAAVRQPEAKDQTAQNTGNTAAGSDIPRLDLGSIAPANCQPVEKERFVGSVPSQLCVVGELVNLHVIRAGGQTIVGVGSVPEPIRAFPFPVEVSDDVGVLVTEGEGVWGGIVTYRVTPSDSAPFSGWALVKASQDGVKSCAVAYGEGEVSDADLRSIGRIMSSGFLNCGRGDAIWSGSGSDGFVMMMRLMNVKFAA